MKKNITHKIFILLLSIVISSNIIAQNSIKGYVIDQDKKKAMAFATVFLPEQNKGTLTDENGYFILNNIAKGEIKIQFSFVGYKSIIKNIIIEQPITEIEIEMEKSILQAEEVVISGGIYSSQHENAIKIELIKGEDIASMGTPNFIEAIASVAGIDMISKGSGVAKPVIRGLSMTNILILNNGVKLENFQFSENHPFIIDEFGIDRIEIIKGPASLLYGSDAVGGVINILKEKPAPIGKITGDYNLQYHSNTQGLVSNLGIKGSSEKFFWGLRSGIKTHQDYIDGNGNSIPNTRFNEYSIKSCLGINTSFALFRIYYDYNRPKLGMSVSNAIPFISSNERNNEVWYQDLRNHIISSKNTLFLGNYKLNINTAWQMNNRRLQTDENMPSFEMVNMDLNTFSYDVKAHLPSTENSEYIIGIQGAHKNNKNHEAPSHVIPDANVNDISFFGLIQYNLFKKIKTQAGIRYDFRHISTKAEAYTSAIDKKYANISTSFGGTYKIQDHTLLRINFASAYRTPNIAELTQNGMHGIRYEEGNPELNSQRNYEADMSVHFHSKYIMLDISVFYNNINNYIYIAPTNDSTINGDKIYRYTQSNAKLYGSEISIDAIPLSWMDLSASFAYLMGQQDNAMYLPFIPQNKLKFNLKLQKENCSFLQDSYIKAGVQYAFAQLHPAMFESESNAYFLLHAGIGTKIRWNKQLMLFSIQINNIFNECYIDHLSTLKESGYYNMGRNISFNIKIPFILSCKK